MFKAKVSHVNNESCQLSWTVLFLYSHQKCVYYCFLSCVFLYCYLLLHTHSVYRCSFCNLYIVCNLSELLKYPYHDFRYSAYKYLSYSSFFSCGIDFKTFILVLCSFFIYGYFHFVRRFFILVLSTEIITVFCLLKGRVVNNTECTVGCMKIFYVSLRTASHILTTHSPTCNRVSHDCSGEGCWCLLLCWFACSYIIDGSHKGFYSINLF